MSLNNVRLCGNVILYQTFNEDGETAGNRAFMMEEKEGLCRFWLPFGYPTKLKWLSIKRLTAIISTQTRYSTDKITSTKIILNERLSDVAKMVH